MSFPVLAVRVLVCACVRVCVCVCVRACVRVYVYALMHGFLRPSVSVRVNAVVSVWFSLCGPADSINACVKALFCDEQHTLVAL